MKIVDDLQSAKQITLSQLKSLTNHEDVDLIYWKYQKVFVVLSFYIVILKRIELRIWTDLKGRSWFSVNDYKPKMNTFKNKRTGTLTNSGKLFGSNHPGELLKMGIIVRLWSAKERTLNQLEHRANCKDVDLKIMIFVDNVEAKVRLQDLIVLEEVGPYLGRQLKIDDIAWDTVVHF